MMVHTLACVCTQTIQTFHARSKTNCSLVREPTLTKKGSNTHRHTQTHTYTHTRIHMHTYTCTHTHTHTHTHTVLELAAPHEAESWHCPSGTVCGEYTHTHTHTQTNIHRGHSSFQRE